MTEQTETTNNIRSDLIDIAIGFLKNPKVTTESYEKKRDFLLKKGLNENEIEYAFKIIPQKETSKEIVPNHRPSFFRRILSDLIFAGLLGFAFKILKRWFKSKRSTNTNDLNETLKTLQKTVQDMQTSVTKLEQAADQLHLSMHSTTTNASAFEEIKREIQVLKGLFLGRSQFPSIPQIGPPKIPSWQLETAEKLKNRASATSVEPSPKLINDDNREDTDSIVLVSENEKNQSSLSPSSESSNDT